MIDLHIVGPARRWRAGRLIMPVLLKIRPLLPEWLEKGAKSL
jgi:hypothetical protein